MSIPPTASDVSSEDSEVSIEAVAYSLMMAASNLTMSLSDVIGSWMYDKLNWTFMHLVWLNGGSTFLILIVIPFLPKVLMDRRDGEVSGG